MTQEKLKTCRDCKRQSVYSTFPQQKDRHGNYYALPRCSECHAKSRVAYRNQNRTHIAQYNAMWRSENPDWNERRKLGRFLSDACKRGLCVDISEDRILSLFQTPCKYCGELIGLNGIDRVDNQQGYIDSNVVACCSPCNFMKHTAPLDSFEARIKKIYEHLNLSKERS